MQARWTLTEMLLAKSPWSGEPVRLNVNRKFLARALKLGFRDLSVYGDKVRVVCHDEQRHIVRASHESVATVTGDVTRILLGVQLLGLEMEAKGLREDGLPEFNCGPVCGRVMLDLADNLLFGHRRPSPTALS